MPNENRSRCVSIDEQIIDYRNPWAAGSMAFALFGKHLHLLYISLLTMTPKFFLIPIKYVTTNYILYKYYFPSELKEAHRFWSALLLSALTYST
jgi:hypothetical protein